MRYGLESPVVSATPVLDGRFIRLVYRFFEASDSFAERFAQFGELAWTENHQGNYKNNDQLRHTKASKHTTPPDEDAITLRFGVRDVNPMTGWEFGRLPLEFGCLNGFAIMNARPNGRP